MSIDAILDPYKFFYMIYAGLYYISVVLILLFVYPYLRIALSYSSFDVPKKRLAAFAGAALLFCVAVIAYTISVREDLGRVAPRLHVRYIAPFIMMVFMLFLSSYDKEEVETKQKIDWWVLLLLFSVTSSAMFKGLTVGSSVDQYSFMWVYRLQQNIADLCVDSDGLVFHLYLWVVRSIIVLISLLVIYVSKKKKTASWLVIVAFLLVVNVWSVIDTRRTFKPGYTAAYDDVMEVVRISNSIDDGADVLVVLNSARSYEAKLLDTYLPAKGNEYFVGEKIFRENDGEIRVGDVTFEEILWKGEYDEIKKLDYILIDYRNIDTFYLFNNMNLVKEVGGRRFLLYKNNDPVNISYSKLENNGLADGVLYFFEFYCNDLFEFDGEGYSIMPGGIVYGPYDSIEAGNYVVTCYGDGISALDYDVWSNGGQRSFETKTESSSGNELRYIVSIPEDIPDIEFRFFNNSGQNAQFEKLILNRIE